MPMDKAQRKAAKLAQRAAKRQPAPVAQPPVLGSVAHIEREGKLQS